MFEMFGQRGAVDPREITRRVREQQRGEDADYYAYLDDDHDIDPETEAAFHRERAMRKKTFITEKGKRFVDLRRILVRGGRGGNGCVSWFREPWVRRKKPDGADGGTGGDVVIVADERVSSLDAVGLTTDADKGAHAKGHKRVGKHARDRKLLVPVGTVVRVESVDENDDKIKTVVADLTTPGASYRAVTGGVGGRGNTGGLESTRIYDVEDPLMQGTEGTEQRLELELKTIADVGLVGLPNAGKSTFLGAVSRAHPKIAPYPFTTLNPHIGTVEFDDHFRFSVADIPGLAVGAADNVGLGHAFLRHIERSTILVYLIDVSGQNGAMDAVEALRCLRAELETYRPGLGRRTAIVAANKMDAGAHAMTQFSALRKAADMLVVPVSSKLGRGVTDVTKLLRTMVEADRAANTEPAPAASAPFIDQLLETGRIEKGTSRSTNWKKKAAAAKAAEDARRGPNDGQEQEPAPTPLPNRGPTAGVTRTRVKYSE